LGCRGERGRVGPIFAAIVSLKAIGAATGPLVAGSLAVACAGAGVASFTHLSCLLIAFLVKGVDRGEDKVRTSAEDVVADAAGVEAINTHVVLAAAVSNRVVEVEGAGGLCVGHQNRVGGVAGGDHVARAGGNGVAAHGRGAVGVPQGRCCHVSGGGGADLSAPCDRVAVPGEGGGEVWDLSSSVQEEIVSCRNPPALVEGVLVEGKGSVGHEVVIEGVAAEETGKAEGIEKQ